MVLTRETLKAIIEEYQGFPLSDAELERVRPELENYCRPWNSFGAWTSRQCFPAVFFAPRRESNAYGRYRTAQPHHRGSCSQNPRA